MRDFFIQEIDYIFFVYGLSFLILASVCAVLSRKKTERLPWGLLGLFGLVHGINEWLDMFAVTLNDSPVFSYVRLVFLIASFVYLLEFGRRSMAILEIQRIPGSVYAPFAIGIISSVLLGPVGVNVVTRYLIGFTGSFVSAVAIYRLSRSKERSRWSLSLVSLSFLVYAFMTGLVPPKIPLWPASALNHGSFLAVVGIPVQLVRCVAATLAAIGIWFYHREEVSVAEGKILQRTRYLNQIIISSLLVIIFAGWLLTMFLGNVRKSEIINDARIDVNKVMHDLLSDIKKSRQIARTLSQSPLVLNVCNLSKDEQSIAAVNGALSRYAEAFEEGVCYLIATDGVTIASSNKDSSASFVGKSYAFRPYFKEAMAGRAGQYFALGVTSGERGYYASYPVRDEADQVTGVVVLKHLLDGFQQRIKPYPYCYLIDPHGIVFISGDMRHLGRSLWPVEMSEVQAIVESKQFGSGPFIPLWSKAVSDEGEIVYGGERLRIFRAYLKDSDWSIVYATSLHALYYDRFFGIIITLFTCVIVIVLMNIMTVREYLFALVEIERDRAWAYFDIAGAILVVLDPSGVVVDINRRGCEVLGYQQGEIIGKDWVRHFIPDRLRRDTENTLKSLASGQVAVRAQHENPLLPRSGLERMISWRNSVIRSSSGKVTNILSSGEDVTDIRRSEQQLKESFEALKRVQTQLIQTSKMASVGQLASGVAHEINNPLTGVLNNVQLIKMEASATKDFNIAQFTDMLNVIEESALRCKKITKSLLDFAGPSRHESVAVDLSESAHKVYDLLCREFELDNIMIVPELDAAVPEVSGDEQLIKQVIFDIINNAHWAIRKRYGQKGGRIVLRTFYDAKKKMAAISVADNGIGIEPEHIGKIFDPFFTTKTVGEGTGLGLAISFNIIKSHGGRIEVASQVGKGAVFTVWMPVNNGGSLA